MHEKIACIIVGKDMEKTCILACNTLRNELEGAIYNTRCSYPVFWIESGLHQYPERLKGRIQEEMDRFSNIDTLLLVFGYCGNAVLGLTPPSFELVFPRVDDCITLLLGSGEARKEIESLGTYFLTEGWLEHENNLWKEYQYTLEKYGEKRGKRLFALMLKHYTDLVVIDTGCYDIARFHRRAEEIAFQLGLSLETVPGTTRYLEKLLTGPYDQEFIRIPPGKTVTMKDLYTKGEEVLQRKIQ